MGFERDLSNIGRRPLSTGRGRSGMLLAPVKMRKFSAGGVAADDVLSRHDELCLGDEKTGVRTGNDLQMAAGLGLRRRLLGLGAALRFLFGDPGLP